MPSTLDRPNLMILKSSTEDKSMRQMDPRLQKLIVLKQNGVPKKATASTSANEVAVIAKIKDLTKWQELSQVRHGSVLGDKGNPVEGSYIVTARIPVSQIEFIRELPMVISLKAAQRLSLSLDATGRDTELLSIPAAGLKGKWGQRAVMGVVDMGCGFAHKNFQGPNKKSRIETLWDQNGSKANSPLRYGTIYPQKTLNIALATKDPYAAVGYDPGPQAHGTHVMDIAAGNGKGTGKRGMASDATIIFVHVAASDIPWSGPNVVEGSFGDSVQLLEAIEFIFTQAGDRPCVINISLGTNGGPHDGSMLVEQAIDRLTNAKPNRAVVIAASNSFADKIHTSGKVNPTSEIDLKWQIPVDDFTESEMEIWYSGNSQLEVEIIDPKGKSIGSIPAGNSGSVKKEDRVILFAANRLNDPNNHDNVIGIFLNDDTSGVWTVRLRNLSAQPATFHAWIERDDNRQSSFVGQNSGDFTLGSISCGNNTITVGSYDAHKAARGISYFSSAGPTRDNRQKPEISAPGGDVLAADSGTTGGLTNMSGTSMASPAVAGILAVYLSEAKARGIDQTIAQIRTALIKSGRKATQAGWDNRYGFGRISAKLLLEQLLGRTVGGSSKSGKPSRAKKPGKSIKIKAKTKKSRK